jgi:hypothetical protein
MPAAMRRWCGRAKLRGYQMKNWLSCSTLREPRSMLSCEKRFSISSEFGGKQRDSARGHDVAMLLRRAEGRSTVRQLAVLDVKQYQGRTWLTRPRPEIDRVGSAWLISKFIDRKPKFVFAPSADAFPNAIPFDMLDAEFSHHGNCCTFETLIRRFAISDKSLGKIGEMIHDADLDDARFQRVEAVGIDRVLKGWAKEGLPDKEILRRGFECFDALYAFLQRR